MKTWLTSLLLLFSFSIALAEVASFGELRNAAKENDFPLRLKIEEKIRQEGRLTIDLYKSSLDIRSVIMEQSLIPILEDFESQIDLNIIYVINKREDGAFECLSGTSELEETKRQLTIQKFYPEKYFDYLKIRGNALYKDNWKDAVIQIGLIPLQLTLLSESDQVKNLMQKNYENFANDFQKFTQSSIYINDQNFQLGPEMFDSDCCNFFQCLFNCTEGELADNALELGAAVITAFSTCTACGEIPTLINPACWGCVVSVGIAVFDIIECATECLLNPCKYEGQLNCDVGEYCHTTWSLIAPITPTSTTPVVLKNSTCEKCPVIDVLDNSLGDKIMRITSYPRGSTNLIQGPTTLGAVFAETEVAYRYVFKKNEDIIEEATVTVPPPPTTSNPIVYTLFNIDNYDPLPGDRFCLEYWGEEGYEDCSYQFECVYVECPEVEFSLVTNGFNISLEQSGYPESYTIHYYITKTGEGLVLGSEGDIQGNDNDVLVEFPYEFGAEYCLNYVVNTLFSTGEPSAYDICSDEICLTADFCDLAENQISVNYDPTSIQEESNPGANDGKVQLSASGGSGNYTFINLAYPDEYHSSTFANLSGGNHCFKAIDLDTGCESEDLCFNLNVNCDGDGGGGGGDPGGSGGGNINGDDPNNLNDGMNGNTGHHNDGLSDDRPEESKPAGDERPGDGGTTEGLDDDDPPPGDDGSGSCIQLLSNVSHESIPDAADGSIEINLTSGLPPFYYYWDDLQGASTSSRDGLAPGQYCVTIYSTTASGSCCSRSKCFTIKSACEAANIKFPDIEMTPSSNCATANGSLELNGDEMSGGTPPFTFEWSNGATGIHAEDLVAGTYSVTATDAFGCTASTSVELEPKYPLSFSAQGTDPSYPDCDGSINIKIQNGSPPYTISLLEGSNVVTSFEGNNTVYSFDGLCAGDYTITVEGASGCTASNNVSLNWCQPILIDEPTITNSTGCQTFGGAPIANGSIDFGQNQPLSGTAPFTYAWSNGATTLSVNNLAVGQHTLTITDANACSSEYDYQVNSGTGFIQFNVEIIEVENDLENNCEGSITVHLIYSGNSPYIYLDIYPGGQQFQVPKTGWFIDENITFSGLCGDDYTITASTEDNLPPNQVCSIEMNASVESCPGFQLLVPPTIVKPSDCETNNGSITYGEVNTPYGGTEPYTWLWSNGSNNDYSITDLEAGMYALTIIDANGCSIEQTFDLTVPNDPAYTEYNILQQPTNGCDGIVEVTGVSGVLATLTLPSGQNQQIVLNSYTSYIFDDLCIGDYILTATSQNTNCEQVFEFTLDGCGTIEEGLVQIDRPTGCDVNDGGLRIVNGFSGGVYPYTYTMTHNENAIPPIVTTSATFTGLPSGNYTLMITDAIGCETSFSYDLLAVGFPEVLASFVEPECEDLFNGVIEVYAVTAGNGGFGDFTFELIPNVGEVEQDGLAAEFTGLETGNYQVMITGNGCSITEDFFVDEIPSMGIFQLSNPPTSEASCPYVGQESGSITFTLEGGTKPYRIRLDNNQYLSSDAEQTQPTDITFTDLAPGVYCTEYIQDDCGRLIDNVCITVEAYPEMFFDFDINVDCPGASDVNFTLSGGTAPFVYEWTGPGGFTASTPDINNLNQGNYQLKVTDGNGCYLEESIFVAVLNPPIVNVSVDVPVACPSYPIGEISINGISGGKPPYNIEWVAQSTGNVYSTDEDIDCLPPDTYILEITDGCDVHSIGQYTISSENIDTRDHSNSCYNEIWCGTFQVDLEFGGVSMIESHITDEDCTSGRCAVTIHCNNGNEIEVTGEESATGNFSSSGTTGSNCECCQEYDCYVDQYIDVALSIMPNPCSNEFLQEQEIIYINEFGQFKEEETPQAQARQLVTSGTNSSCPPGDFTIQYTCGGNATTCEDCILDTDGDLIPDSEDTCPFTYNPAPFQTVSGNDCNGNGIVDICESFTATEDADADNIPDFCDNCIEGDGPIIFNPLQLNVGCDLSVDNDLDNDGIPDGQDNCFDGTTAFPNPHQFDCDGDGIGDVCDPDYPCSPNSPQSPIPMTIIPGNDIIDTDRNIDPKTVANNFIAIHPNPFQNDFTIDYQSEEEMEELKINLYHLNGGLLQQQTYEAVKGNNTFTFHLTQQLPNGVYKVEIIGKKNIPMSFKLVKLDR